MRVWVVTDDYAGEENIVGVFDPLEISLEELEDRFRNKNGYSIFDQEVLKTLEP